ncbi:uncharacterized protein LOC141852694 isoform X1 [Brevipalpus obovatus]|uniref:uncharacterized protein LOC141852694 isoform X1 n=1 Tax=Brevipalpus obovatus TaxID=246614 RepID=UPI003D9EDD77
MLHVSNLFGFSAPFMVKFITFFTNFHQVLVTGDHMIMRNNCLDSPRRTSKIITKYYPEESIWMYAMILVGMGFVLFLVISLYTMFSREDVVNIIQTYTNKTKEKNLQVQYNVRSKERKREQFH